MLVIETNQQLAELIKRIKYIPFSGVDDEPPNDEGIMSPVINPNRWTQISEYIQGSFKSFESFENFFKIYNPTIPTRIIRKIHDGYYANCSYYMKR